MMPQWRHPQRMKVLPTNRAFKEEHAYGCPMSKGLGRIQRGCLRVIEEYEAVGKARRRSTSRLAAIRLRPLAGTITIQSTKLGLW